MKYTLLVLIALSLPLSVFAQDPSKHDNPGSLWVQNAPDPLKDKTACKVGDVITIIISESSASSFSAQTNTSKSDNAGILKGLGPIIGNLIPSLGIGASSTTAGSGSTIQTGTFATRMSAVVKEVLPNGNLAIEGIRDIQTNKDTQTIKLSGTIRREDIRPDNTVLSVNIANATIKAVGKGQISDRQRKGLLVRLLDWLF